MPTFCPSCGKAAGEGDRFCRACGTAVGPESPAGEPTTTIASASGPETGAAASAISSTAGRKTPRRKRLAAFVALGLLAVAAAVAILVVSASDGPTAAEKRARQAAAAQKRSAAEQAALRSRLTGPFEQGMALRTMLFAAERTFLGANADSSSKVAQYRAQTVSVQQQTQQIDNSISAQRNACSQPGTLVACPSPTYPAQPSAPDVQGDITRLRSGASRLANLNAQALAVTPPPEMKTFYAQLEAAISQLRTDSQYDADTLTQGVTEPDPNSSGNIGNVDLQKVATLHGDEGLPSIRLLNDEAVRLIRLLQLDIKQYDVPGGTDADASDHSTAQ